MLKKMQTDTGTVDSDDIVADVIIGNARILTMDPRLPRAEAIALRGDRILAVGTSIDLQRFAGQQTCRIDAAGATVLPGFIESHVHFFMAGAEMAHLQLAGVSGYGPVSSVIRSWAAAHPEREVLMAYGADHMIFGRPATRQDLDRILPDRPFVMAAADHHTVWANTPALTAAGILKGRVTLPGSEVVMGEDGLATGELREPDAYAPVLSMAG